MNASLFNVRNGLIALAAVLAIGLGFETDWGTALTAQSPAARNVAGKHDAASVLPDFRLGSDAGAYAQIADKPLLNPSRKPAPAQAAVAVTEPPKPQIRRGLYQLVGVTDLGTVRIAQVRELSSNRIASVREGDSLQEFTVQRVSAEQIVLAFQNETDALKLPTFTASSRVPSPPRPAVSAQPAAQAVAMATPQAPTAVPSPAAAKPAAATAQPASPVDRNAVLSPTPLPNGQPYTTANAEAFIEARRRARFGQ